ncbi:hypothetical protein A2690_03320 [Candidatus Roizmanbacteria bacterium RIFCSPHIGHO2_01_FULL_39_12b]|uniref:YYY membrane protein n=1 Tax=Candidatus Roizmanbacteria bacterium RIFCSPHIGHO2_01_FULL_39_12b TaxID=1802030 RepID=A0A1F7GCM7_9BACT|nr:MAG: hypothetical protein A2690_03320 [Candidatus Roizmanbacteria bacterium RIFCSPHIGHO2_01_FULL_39_12b]OGK46694.1 MAG: hypothetical protein A3B46_02570 [Candidatus Roizmanbacteria bacterium RIFCSPLOWO2_01_FULL_39_19]
MDWLSTALIWYFMLALLGLFFLPLTGRLFSRFFDDGGYPFAKTIGIISISYAIFLLVTLKLVPFTTKGIMIVVAAFILLNLIIIIKNQSTAFIDIFKTKIIIFEELLFLGAFIFWVFVRGQEPSAHTLEKFMDFGFINSIFKSVVFPPPDMWFSGHSINYYYFGHLTGAVLSKLTPITTATTYNLILATIFALSVTQIFSLGFTLTKALFKSPLSRAAAGVMSAFIVNLAGNLHTIYLFTKGYPNDKPVPFWEILSKFDPTSYWYPNATRFIPFTIHEFPIYSYVVADLHGHVFDIPFVILTIAISYIFLAYKKKGGRLETPFSLLFGFLIAISYMTNALDGPIYLLFTALIGFFVYPNLIKFLKHISIVVLSFVVFSLPFSLFFKPFTTGIGVNCAPKFLTNIGKLGPFLFEAGNCQHSFWWMWMLLWGFFIFNALFFALFYGKKVISLSSKKELDDTEIVSILLSVCFILGTFLVIVPEFFYIKDIYPAHFRANTMFKLGYQAFIVMGLASSVTIFLLKKTFQKKKPLSYIIYVILVIPQLFLIGVYPYFAVRSYYGTLNKTPQLNGTKWLETSIPDYTEIVNYLNNHADSKSTIIEAQGDSYTDFNVVSSYTGLPTVGGWYVHQWLWRGKPEVLQARIPDIETVYKNPDIVAIKNVIKKYNIGYIIYGPNERQKYGTGNEEILPLVGVKTFKTTSGVSYIIKTH